MENVKTSGDGGQTRSKQLNCTGKLPVSSFGEAQRAPTQTRDRRKQNGFRGDNERTAIDSRLAKCNRANLAYNNYPRTETAKYETGSGMRYSSDATGSLLHCYRSCSRAFANSTAAARIVKNRSPSQFHSYADKDVVRLRQPSSMQTKLPVQTISVGQRETVTRQINTRRTELNNERTDQTSRAPVCDDVTEEQQRQRILDWLSSVSNSDKRPPSPNIDDSPTHTQTDTAIHVVYNGE